MTSSLLSMSTGIVVDNILKQFSTDENKNKLKDKVIDPLFDYFKEKFRTTLFVVVIIMVIICILLIITIYIMYNTYVIRQSINFLLKERAS